MTLQHLAELKRLALSPDTHIWRVREAVCELAVEHERLMLEHAAVREGRCQPCRAGFFADVDSGCPDRCPLADGEKSTPPAIRPRKPRKSLLAGLLDRTSGVLAHRASSASPNHSR